MADSADMQVFREGRLRRARRQATTLARAIRAGRARAKAAPQEVPQVDGRAVRGVLAEVAAEAELLSVPVNRPPWTATRMRVEAGEQVSWLAWGLVYLAKPLGIAVGPAEVLRGRAGGGLQQSARATLTFTADRSGPVELGSMFPGEPREDGTIAVDRLPYRAMTGSLSAVLARWRPDADPREALEAAAARDPSGLCAAEAERLADPPQPPPGWDHHPLAPRGEVYAPSPEGVAAHTRSSVAIIRRPAEARLTPTLRLRWSWRISELPSELPEDTTLTHDYLSVALEFDDGQDLTWHWSCALPEGFAYRCPLEHWRRRETHVVVRSGSGALGRWVDEERPVLADHRAAIGGPAPARVVRAWLISVSLFQGGEGRGEFGRIELVDGEDVVRVL